MAQLAWTVKGKISHVRWLEAEYAAQKVRSGKYWNYAFQTPDMDGNAYRELHERICGTEYAPSGCWVEVTEVVSQEEIDADEAAWADEAARAPILPAFADISAYLVRQGKAASNYDCMDFAAQQVAKIQRRARTGHQRLADIFAALTLASPETAAKVYGENKEWLKEIAR